MFVYSYSIKICALGFNELLESIFQLLLVVEVFSLQKDVEMLEEVVVGWREVRRIWQKRQNFMAQFVQLPKLCDVCLGTALENWVFSVDQCGLQLLEFSVHCINLLSIFLRCNRFPGFRKLQWIRGQQITKSDHDSWYKFGFGKRFGASSQSNHRAGHGRLPCKTCFSSHVIVQWRNGSLLLHRIREDNTSKWQFFDLRSVHEASWWLTW